MELLNYLLKVSACTVLFYAFYLLVLQKLTFFKINRFYLLATLLLSFSIPALNFTVEREVATTPTAYTETFVQPSVVEQPVISEPIVFTHGAEQSFDWYSLLPNLYLVTVGCLLAIAFWRLFQLFKHTKTGTEEIDGLKVVAKAKGFTNCSFFNYVFIDNKNITEAELQVLLKHEAVHAQQFHSIDKMLLIIAKAVLWFNPIVYLYDKALEQAHEYEADEATSKSFGTESYANLLLRLAIAKSEMPLVHNFVKSPIKARIKMLFNSKSKNMKKLMYLLALPVGLGLLWGFTVDVVEVPVKNGKNWVAQTKDVKPILQRKIVTDEKGIKCEEIVIQVKGKKINTIHSAGIGKAKVFFYVNGKVYSEAEIAKFSPDFVAKLSDKHGAGNTQHSYSVDGIKSDINNYVIWFGEEPPLTSYMAKNRSVFEKYNGKTVSGNIVGYSFSPKNKALMDGFILKTNNGETLKAFVEPKFVKQINAQLAKGDEVAIKIYNAAYWKDNEYPVLTSFKLNKGDKLLMDRWPKTVSKIVASNQPKKIENETAKLTELNLSKTGLADADHKISYSYLDSTRIDKANHTVYLYGKAKINVDKNLYEGSSIVYNKKLNSIKVYDASISNKDSKSIFTADSLYLNLNTSKGVLFGKTTQVSFK